MKLEFGARPLIMGILNVTPDSFYDGGKYSVPEKAVERAMEMCVEGADILDVGGESSRPGAKPVSGQEEMDRVCPVIERIAGRVSVPISIDTCKSVVAREALKAGAMIVNDISALRHDDEMGKVVSQYGAYIILMHMQGTPGTMQDNPEYVNVVGEICEYLQKRAESALQSGIDGEKIIIDPGIGFGKTLTDNYRILKNLKCLKALGYPVLVGLSRKALIKGLYDTDADRLPATIALNALSAFLGADILRVHDVKEHRLAMAAVEMMNRTSLVNGSCN